MKTAFSVAEVRFVGSHVGLETIIPLAGLVLRSSLLHGKKSNFVVLRNFLQSFPTLVLPPLQGQFSLAYLLERGTHGASRNLSEAERFYRLSGQQQNMGAAAAATLAIGKLKVLMLMERYEEHGAVVWRWVGPIYTWSQNVCAVIFKSLWKAQEVAVQFLQRVSGWGKKDETAKPR
jgi:hypothetical protein